ncbi:MAG: GTP-binding protein [Ginsengibacter sp.]
MKIHLLSGFLGSGKTTAIQNGCNELMKKQLKAGVITNDQGVTLVDGSFFEYLNIPNRQVLNGCFCCNYNDLDNSIQSLITANQPDVIFAESVGSCTDIIATVLKPLIKFRPEAQITLSTFADARLLKILLEENSSVFDESVRYIYLKQLEEAEIIVISKIDLIDYNSLQEIKRLMNKRYGGKTLLYQNSFDAANIHQWLQVLDNNPATTPSSLQINYDVYGEGEAKLAWHDQRLEIESMSQNATGAATGLMKAISKKIHFNKYPVGHLKFLLNGGRKFSITGAPQEDFFDTIADAEDNYAGLLINARVQTSPEALSYIISEAIKETEIKFGCKIVVKSNASFQPGYPKPTHRITD